MTLDDGTGTYVSVQPVHEVFTWRGSEPAIANAVGLAAASLIRSVTLDEDQLILKWRVKDTAQIGDDLPSVKATYVG